MAFSFEWSDDSSDSRSIYTIHSTGVARPNSKLTFGIELEFNVPYLLKGSIDPHPDQKQRVIELEEAEITGRGPSEAVLKALRKQIEIVYGEKGHQRSDIMIAGYPASKDPENKQWDLKEDGSVEEPSFKGKGAYAGWVNVEIASRVFTNHDWNDIARSEYVIGQIARYIRYEHRVRINSTCGFHVHVGLEDQLPRNLVAIKRLATILWLAEDLLEPLYHPARREENGLNDYCASLTRHSTLSEFIPNQNRPDDEYYKNFLKEPLSKKPDLAMRIAAIWKARGLFDLTRILRPAPGQIERLNYNFLSLEEARGTIEFREMESTLNEDLLKYWPRVCKKLILYAKRKPLDERMGKSENQHFRELVQDLVERPAELTTWRFLQKMCCEPDIIEFFQKKEKWDAESWEELQSFGPNLGDTVFPYRLQSNFFQDQLTTEYGRSF